MKYIVLLKGINISGKNLISMKSLKEELELLEYKNVITYLNSGNIYIDNVKINDLTRENIHDLFIMVLQDTWLFEGTIKDNIKFNKKNVTDNEVWKAL